MRVRLPLPAPDFMNIKDAKILQNELRQILNDWDFIGGVPEDEYDCLRDKIITHLQKYGDLESLKKALVDEITGHFGIEIRPETGIDKQAQIILSWWNSK